MEFAICKNTQLLQVDSSDNVFLAGITSSGLDGFTNAGSNDMFHGFAEGDFPVLASFVFIWKKNILI